MVIFNTLKHHLVNQISTRSLTNFNHYIKYSLACTANWLKLQPCSVLFSLDTLITLFLSSKIHVRMNRTNETQKFFTVFQFSVTCLNKAYEIQLELLSSFWILLCWHSIIRHLNLVSFIWLCIVFNLDNV